MKLSEKLKKLKEESLIGNIYPTDEVEDTFDECIKDAELLESKAELYTLLYTVLEKYVSYVMDAEGTDFISIHDHKYMSDVKFTNEEWKILEKISEKVNYPNGI
jgi:hypothetical protein